MFFLIAIFPAKSFAAETTPGTYYGLVGRDDFSTQSFKVNGSGKISHLSAYSKTNAVVFSWDFPTGTSLPYSYNEQPPPKQVSYVKVVLLSGTLDSVDLAGVIITQFSSSLPDGNPPAAPTGLIAVPGVEQITLRWDPNKESDMKGYYVYQDGVKLTASSIPDTQYVVTGLTGGKTYTFSVAAVDQSGNVSTKTSVTATPDSKPPPPDTTPPSVPVLSGKPGNGQAVLTWTKSPEPDVAGYNVYQDGKKAGNYTGNSATFSGLENGNEYSFQVTAIDTAGNESAKSNTVKVTPAEKLDVNLIPNGDSIIVQIIAGGVGPYVIDWVEAKKTVDQSQYTIGNLKFNTEYTVTVTDSNGLTYTRTINTGDTKGYVPPTFPNPQEMFQRMLDVFGTAGTIGLAIIGGAVALGILCVLALWAWRLLKRWLSRAK